MYKRLLFLAYQRERNFPIVKRNVYVHFAVMEISLDVIGCEGTPLHKNVKPQIWDRPEYLTLHLDFQ